MELITREQWGAKHGRGHVTDGAKTLLVVHHDGFDRLAPDSTLDDEIEVWRMFERFHALTNGWGGIAYSFGLMPYSGRIFEGRGWGRTGAHTPGRNSSAWGICVPCDGDTYDPDAVVIDAFQAWRREGIRLGQVNPIHNVKGHQDFNKPDCPGAKVYRDLVAKLDPLERPALYEIVRAHPTLRMGKGGARGSGIDREAVKVLQRRLADMQELARRHVTGYFGDLTEAAVRRVQRKYRLTVDGIVGPDTYRVIEL